MFYHRAYTNTTTSFLFEQDCAWNPLGIVPQVAIVFWSHRMCTCSESYTHTPTHTRTHTHTHTHTHKDTYTHDQWGFYLMGNYSLVGIKQWFLKMIFMKYSRNLAIHLFSVYKRHVRWEGTSRRHTSTCVTLLLQSPLGEIPICSRTGSETRLSKRYVWPKKGLN